MGKRTIECEVCNKVFTSSHWSSKYCSAECYNIVQKLNRRSNTEVKACIWCGKEFSTSISTQKYCSKKCRAQSQSNERAKGKQGKICAICGDFFQSSQPAAKYCSESCKAIRHQANRKAKLPKDCEFCGTTFIAANSQAKYCCKSCYVKAKYQRSQNPKDIKREHNEMYKSDPVVFFFMEELPEPEIDIVWPEWSTVPGLSTNNPQYAPMERL